MLPHTNVKRCCFFSRPPNSFWMWQQCGSLAVCCARISLKCCWGAKWRAYSVSMSCLFQHVRESNTLGVAKSQWSPAEPNKEGPDNLCMMDIDFSDSRNLRVMSAVWVLYFMLHGTFNWGVGHSYKHFLLFCSGFCGARRVSNRKCGFGLSLLCPAMLANVLKIVIKTIQQNPSWTFFACLTAVFQLYASKKKSLNWLPAFQK